MNNSNKRLVIKIPKNSVISTSVSDNEMINNVLKNCYKNEHISYDLLLKYIRNIDDDKIAKLEIACNNKIKTLETDISLQIALDKWFDGRLLTFEEKQMLQLGKPNGCSFEAVKKIWIKVPKYDKKKRFLRMESVERYINKKVVDNNDVKIRIEDKIKKISIFKHRVSWIKSAIRDVRKDRELAFLSEKEQIRTKVVEQNSAKFENYTENVIIEPEKQIELPSCPIKCNRPPFKKKNKNKLLNMSIG